MADVNEYTFQIWYSKDDKCYIASILEFENSGNMYCKAHGDTPNDALREIQIAGEMMIEALLEDGQPLPVPMVHVA